MVCSQGFHTLINGGLFSRFPLPYKWWFVLLPNQCGTSQSTPFRAQRPRWHSFLPPIDVEPPPNPPPFGTQHPYWHTASCLPPEPKSTPLWGPASLLAHSLMSTPLRGTARKLAHRPVSGSDTICNDPDPPLADIVLFGLSLEGKGRFPHPYKWWFVLLPNQCGTSHLRHPNKI